MSKKASNRDRIVSLSEGERLTLRFMLADKTKWFKAVARAYSLHETDDITQAEAILGILELKLANDA